jgi:hypothetical protein
MAAQTFLKRTHLRSSSGQLPDSLIGM